MYALVIITDLSESKDMTTEGEIEDVLSLAIKKKKEVKPVNREIYGKLMTEISKKLKKSSKTEEEQKEDMTEDQAMAKLAQMKEEDQILASELLSLDIPVLRIVKCFEMGLKEVDKILDYKEPVKEQKTTTILFSLISMNFEVKDTAGNAEIFQNKQGHFVISNSIYSPLRKEILAPINSSIYHDLESFSSTITFLAALEGIPHGDQLNYGLKIGNLELSISLAPGFSCLMINGDISGEVNLSSPIELKIIAKSSGDLIVSHGSSNHEIFDNSVFNGLKTGKFGLFLDEGDKAELLAFEIHDGRHEGTFKNKYSKVIQPTGGENYVTIKCKKENNDRLRLKLLGYSDDEITQALAHSKDTSSAISQLFDNTDMSTLHGDELTLTYESIIDLKLYDNAADLPKGFSLVSLYEDDKVIEYEIPNRKFLAIKKDVLTEGNVVVGFSIGEALKNVESLGDFTVSTVNDRALPVFARMNALSKKETPIKDICLIKSSRVNSVRVPRGFTIISDKEGKALNIAPRNEKNHYIFVGVKYNHVLSNCFVTPYTSMGSSSGSFGIVDSFDNAADKKPSKDDVNYELLSNMELFNLLYDAEEHRIQKSSKKMLLSMLKVSPNVLISLSEREGFGKLVDFLGDDLNLLDDSFTQIIQTSGHASFRQTIIKESLLKLITYCIQPVDPVGGVLSTLTVESEHPYADNLNVDDVITIRGARGLRIEFDPQCYTENGCDQLKFFESPGRVGELACYTGQGEAVWKPLDVQGDTVHTYFHSDGSVHYWGYKFTVIPVGSSTSETVVKADSALWLLEKVANSLQALDINEAIFSPRVIQSLFLFSLASTTTEEKAKAIDIIRKILRGQEHPVINSILKLLLQEATNLYNANKDAKSSHPILQGLILLLAQSKDRYALEIPDDWFIDFSELLSDMKGLADKDVSLEHFLFENFKTKVGVLEKFYESAHPYERSTVKTHIEIEGASSLRFEFDPLSKAIPKDDIYISYDEAGLKSARVASSARTLTSAKWTDNPKGPDVNLSNNNMTATRVSSSGWGNAIWNETYTSNITTIKFYIDSTGDSNYLYIGVYKADESYGVNNYIGTDSPTPAWAWKVNGEFSKKGASHEGQGFAQGDTIAMQIDMNKHELTFFKNNTEVYKFDDLPASVIPAISFGGDNQVVSIRGVEQSSSLGTSDTFDNLEVKGSSAYVWFPVNRGFTDHFIWESEIDKVKKSADEMTITKITAESSIHSAGAKFNAGRHYAEIKVNSDGEIGLGFFNQSTIESGITDDDKRQLIYHSNGKISGIDHSLVDSYTVGDSIGLYFDIDERLVHFYKNNSLVASLEASSIVPNQTYRLAALLTENSQSLTINNNRVLPETIDVLNASTSSETTEWGYKLKVTPSFRGRSTNITDSILSFITREQSQEWSEVFKPKFVQYFKTGAAEQLIIYLDELTESKGLDILALTDENVNPTADELIYYPELERLKVEEIREIYKIILNFNLRIQKLLYLFNLHIESFTNMTELQRVFMGSRNFIFFKLKNSLLKENLSKTACESRTEITVDRPRAMRYRGRKDVDVNGQFSVFGQVFRAMLAKGNREYRNSERFFRVTYRGEAATDAGGPYNETISNMCDELMSSFVRLLIPIPNNVNNMGENRDCWIVNPSADGKTDMDLYLFLGKLMGCAIRTQNNLNLSLSPLFWKRLLLDPVDIRDLRATDLCTVQILEILRNLEANGLTPENFSFAYDIKFNTKDTSGRDIELIENGNNIPVTFENAKEYAELVEKFRLNENAKAYENIRKGISAVIPLDYINLFSWRQVQTLVCGAPNIDVEILKANTDYESCSLNDSHITLFWDVVNEMSQKERSLLIKFIWGRSRLPSGRDWRHMKIARYNPSGPVNNYMPISHTCFFTIDLPVYTTRDAMKNKLLYAITHCSAIDLDGTAGAGWEDND